MLHSTPRVHSCSIAYAVWPRRLAVRINYPAASAGLQLPRPEPREPSAHPAEPTEGALNSRCPGLREGLRERASERGSSQRALLESLQWALHGSLPLSLSEVESTSVHRGVGRGWGWGAVARDWAGRATLDAAFCEASLAPPLRGHLLSRPWCASAGIAHRPPLLKLSKASRNGLGHLVVPLGFHTTSIITGMPTTAIASCTLASVFMRALGSVPSGARRRSRLGCLVITPTRPWFLADDRLTFLTWPTRRPLGLGRVAAAEQPPCTWLPAQALRVGARTACAGFNWSALLAVCVQREVRKLISHVPDLLPPNCEINEG